MDRDRLIYEAVARCVSSAVYYQNCPPSPMVEAVFTEDVHTVVALAEHASFGPREIKHKLLPPLLAELAGRFGEDLGGRLHAVFVEAFRDAGEEAPRGIQVARARALEAASVGSAEPSDFEDGA